MDVTTVNTNNLYLYSGSGFAGLSLNVSYNATTYEATLNPVADLDQNAKYYPSVWKHIKNTCGTRQDVEVSTMLKTEP